MNSIIKSLVSATSIFAVISVTALTASAITSSSDEHSFSTVLRNTSYEISSRRDYVHSNIGFVAERLDSSITQNIEVQLGESTLIYGNINPVGQSVICTSNSVGGGYTYRSCDTSKQHQWRAKKCSDNNYNIDFSIYCGSTPSGNFTGR